MSDLIQKILSLFSASAKIQFYWLIVGVVIASLFELVTISTFVPFMAFVAKGTAIDSNPYLNFLYTRLGFESSNRFLMFLGGIVLLSLVIGNLFSAFIVWCSMRFSFMQGHQISSQLFKTQLNKPYNYFLNQHSSELGKNILNEVQMVVVCVLIPGMQAFSKAVVTVFIFGLLMVVDPILACIVTLVLGGAYVLMYTLIRRRLKYAGNIAVERNAGRYRTVNEAFGGIKDVKILHKEDAFLRLFQQDSLKYAECESMVQVSYLVTRYLLEIVAFGGILTIVLYLIMTQKNLEQVLPLMGLYAFAGYRLMPALQQMFSGMALMRYYHATLDIVTKGVSEANDSQTRTKPLSKETKSESIMPLAFNRQIELKQVEYQYPFAQEKTIRGLNLVLPINQTIGFVGTTGAGKTTVIDIILGLLTPTSGALQVDGVEISAQNINAWQKNVGYVPQHIFLADRSIAQNIAFGLTPEEICPKALRAAAKLANLEQFVDVECEQGFDTLVGEKGIRLSGGQRQRIGIARALYHNPKVLIFDEATSALDNLTEQAIMESIAHLSGQKTILIIAHRLSTVKRCDKIVLLEKGRVSCEGTYDDLLQTNVNFREMTQTS